MVMDATMRPCHATLPCDPAMRPCHATPPDAFAALPTEEDSSPRPLPENRAETEYEDALDRHVLVRPVA